MAELIKCQRDGRILVAVESTPGFPAAALARRKLGATAVQVVPAELLEQYTGEGDLVIAVRRGSHVAQTVVKLLDRKLPALPPSGYHIETVDYSRGTALLVLGGDLFGMLAGLSDALLWSSLTSRGLSCRGGTKTEKPAFGIRYYWTWDHSTNWVLDDPGNQVSGCQNLYLKQPETFLADYRALIDHCVDMRFNGLVVWGFLRDSHGGEDYAWEIARYAADRGVRLLPGVGVTGQGGVYYQGDHPCNLETYLRRNPERGNTDADGRMSRKELSPHFAQNRKWISSSLEWLYRNFPVGGANLENNDFMIDHSPLGKRRRRKIKSDEPDQFKEQYAAYVTALETALELDPDGWHTYATYCGFGAGEEISVAGPNVGKTPYFAANLPAGSIAQWTLTGMLTGSPPALRDWLETGTPRKLYRNRNWPKKLQPPTERSVGYIHQGSQWHESLRRTSLCLKPFAEAAVRAHETGLEGISIHGEVSARTLPWKLNYLTMRHWCYHPNSTLEEFARAELEPRLGGRQEALDFVEALCLLDEGNADDAVACCRDHFMASYPKKYPVAGDLPISRLWEGLLELCYQTSTPGGIVDIL